MSNYGLRYHYHNENKVRIEHFDSEKQRDKKFEDIYRMRKSKKFHFLVKF